MKAIAFADSKFVGMAEKQSANFGKFGIDHEIVRIPEQTYGIHLWIHLMDLTMECIKKHGKIFRVDSEIRLLKDIPMSWHESENVLFFIEPLITYPWYIAINTGHMVLSESSLPFLELLKEMTIAMIPPGYDGHKLGFDDEDLVAPALRLSRIPYKRETIDYYRNDESKAACTRGEWFTEHTIFTHGFMHNWETGSHNIVPYDYLRNNIKPGMPSKTVDGIILGLEKRITSKNYWIKLGFDNSMQLDGWILDPAAGAFWHKDYTTPKFIDPR